MEEDKASQASSEDSEKSGSYAESEDENGSPRNNDGDKREDSDNEEKGIEEESKKNFSSNQGKSPTNYGELDSPYTPNTPNIMGSGMWENEAPTSAEEKYHKKVKDYKALIDYIHAEHRENPSYKWQDPDFPPIMSSIFLDKDKLQELNKDFKNMKWVRPNEIVKESKFKIHSIHDYCDIRVGLMSEGIFIGCIAMISARGFTEKLFIDVDNMDKGYVSFQFSQNGDWVYVVVDTLLPYDPDQKQLIFSQNMDNQEFWVALIEKAYAKLYGSYEMIQKIGVMETMVDLTGGVTERFKIETIETKKLIENGQLFNYMREMLNQNNILGCVKRVYNKTIKNSDPGEHGILENHYHGIIHIEDFTPGLDYRLIKIRNPWGSETNWNGAFSNSADEWDRLKPIKLKIYPDGKQKKQDNIGFFWMDFKDWVKEFTKLYICKIFPEQWSIITIDSKWFGKTAGGKCPPIEETRDELSKTVMKKGYIRKDTDEKWFNNPQFRVTVYKKTKMVISLAQQDRRIDAKSPYIKTSFMVIQAKNKRSRIWEKPIEKEIKCRASYDENKKPKREIVTEVILTKAPGKDYGVYIIIPNTEVELKKNEKKKFFLKLFASENIDVEELPETIELNVPEISASANQWTMENSGGRLRVKRDEQIFDKDKNEEVAIKVTVDNPNWCKNPQYLLTVHRPTNLKIILRRAKALRKKEGTIGLTLCRYTLADESSLLNSSTKVYNYKGKTEIKKKEDATTKLLNQTAHQLQPTKLTKFERKVLVGTTEFCAESQFLSHELAAMYFEFNPIEGPFVIVPSTDREGLNGDYRLTFYSNTKIDVEELDVKRNQVIIGKWSKFNSGGCHLYDGQKKKEESELNWFKNPVFRLLFDGHNEVTKTKISIVIAEKSWKKKLSDQMKRDEKGGRDKTSNLSIGCMIGIYILKGSEIKLENIIFYPVFVPVLDTSITFDFKLSEGSEYSIIPTTYYPKITGEFILSVNSEVPFNLSTV